MVLDNTRYSAFLRNPESFRLRYVLNLAPITLDYALARGLAFHLLLEHHHRGTSNSELAAILQEKIGNDKAIKVAQGMWKEWQRKYSPSLVDARMARRKLAAEFEFLHPMGEGTHSIAGRIDEILDIGGRLMCGEVKTANARANFADKEHEWRYAPQADFEMLGAQMSGHSVEGVHVRYVVEGTPPKIWELDVLRTPQQLETTLRSVAQVADTIEMYLQRYGPDEPWPHSPFNYPCSMAGRCEYAQICGKHRGEVSLDGFKQREEHLACLGG